MAAEPTLRRRLPPMKGGRQRCRAMAAVASIISTLLSSVRRSPLQIRSNPLRLLAYRIGMLACAAFRSSRELHVLAKATEYAISKTLDRTRFYLSLPTKFGQQFRVSTQGGTLGPFSPRPRGT